MGHRDPGVGGGGDGGGDAGDLLEGDAVGGERLQLLAAPAEDEGVAPLEAHYVAPRQGLLQENAVDLLLGHLVVGGLLAHVDSPGLRRDHGENGRAHQPVVDHHLRLTEGRKALQGQKARVPGARPYQRYLSAHSASSLSCRARPSARAGPSLRLPETTPLWSRPRASAHMPRMVMVSPATVA